ncbi:aldo/keto reductase [Vallitalea pronyensis]|uniref:Aldo/keto reductase n=1 Tax=Vallitalea pronyensis TaxID=1348613 RepID=A0A8J8MIN3_9FIRM|nr:aldo/keto reductase [Vallitalea pronyensis]QUI22147.1 aldo/keto reductase [Vallitalea pronyensis]
MKYKRVKKIDFDFSAIGYGCWGASGKGSWSNHHDQDQMKAIQKAMALGVNFFDVAPIYGMGYAETILGKAIKGNRHNIFIATKAGIPWNDQGEARNDVSADSLLKEIDDSLLRLGVDYVNLLQVHWPTDSGVPLEETMTAMKAIKDSGKANYIGLSNYSVSDIKKASAIVDIVSMQGLYNMFEQNAATYHNIPLQYRVSKEIFPYVKEKGMAFFPYSPLFQGLLVGKIKEDTTFGQGDVRHNNPKLHGEERMKYLTLLDKIRNLEPLKDKALNEIAMNYLMAKDQVTSIIATVMNQDELAANVKALEWEMPKETIQEIDCMVEAIEQHASERGA